MKTDIAPELIQQLHPDQAWHYSVVPASDNAGVLELLISSDCKDLTGTQHELELLLNRPVSFKITDHSIIVKILSQHYRRNADRTTSKSGRVYNLKSSEFLKTLIEEAKSVGSSDIHVEAYEEKCRVRLRIDGNLIERLVISKEDYPALINMIKIQANLDISEKRLPQDGRIFYQDVQNKFDIRVSSLPTLYGEKVVLRLLSSSAADIDISTLGFSDTELENYLDGIKKPHGIILISGPTGSGKTTTLYATLKLLNTEKTNILTVEDPIEYTLKGINQVQVKESIGLTFAQALKTFLRQDPDVIMLGEIRDSETAHMAIRASLTGHLVLSTIHTNSAWGTISRLIDMGIPPFLLANTLNTTVAQRLVKCLCEYCKEEMPFDAKLYPRNYKPSQEISTHYVGKGCDHCFYTGYKGRKAIYEVISINAELGESIRTNVHDETAILKMQNIDSLSDNAFKLFEKGQTSLEEIYSILSNQS
ncbi:MAG: type II/IV secretion system protein [Bacteroidetes bacterium]|nr:type II/IV secretion system protein [Bacteroidota bacterium]